MPVIDPNTELDTDLGWMVEMLADLVSQEPIQKVLCERLRATPDGLRALLRLLHHTSGRLGQGHDKAFWRQYSEHIRNNLAEVLEDKEVRKVVGMHMAWKRGTGYKPVLKELLNLVTPVASGVLRLTLFRVL